MKLFNKINNHMAEGVGFEPTEACTSSVFKTDAFNHSTTLPMWAFVAISGFKNKS
jgi:hypothetical protein